MPIVSSAYRSIGRAFEVFKRLYIDYVMGSTVPGQQIQCFSVTGGGTGTDTVTFASTYQNGVALKDMADAAYKIFISGEFAASQGDVVYPDYSSKAATGFNIIGLGAAEICDVMVIGRPENMPDPEDLT